MKKWIDKDDFKNSVESLQLSDEAKNRILKACYERNRPRYFVTRRYQVAFTVLLLSIGVFCSPVAANVRSSLKAWLDQMTQEKVQSIYNSVQKQTVGAASTSRDFSDEELLRKGQLEELYKNGELFPEKEVLVLDKGQGFKSDQVCYQSTNSFWFLPESRLTDEDLLEIIDYEYKINYSLASVNEENGLVETNAVVNPSLSEEQALQTAQELITAAYHVQINRDRIFIEPYSNGNYEIKYLGLELSEGSKASCSILISGEDGKVQNLHYNDKKHTAVSNTIPDSIDQNVWYEKGKKILSDMTGQDRIKSSWCLIYTGQGRTEEITKRIYYLYELEKGDTYTLGFLYSDGILQTLTLGDSYLENQEEYQTAWKFKADRIDATYEIKKIE